MSSLLKRRSLVLLTLLAGIVSLFASTQTWVIATDLGATAAVPEVEVVGTEVSPTLMAMSLVAVASALALSIARRVLRYIIAVCIIGSGLSVAFSGIRTWQVPAQVTLESLGETTGTTEPAGSYEVSLIVAVSFGAAILLIIAGLLVLVASSGWKDAASSKKYSRSRLDTAQVTEDGGVVNAPDEFDLWDGLSEGADLTDSSESPRQEK